MPPASAWLAAVHRTAWVPPEFASYDLAADEAAARLRVPPPLLSRMLDAGLPACGESPPRLDACDVFNLGLEVGWRGTLPVVGFRGALRWLRSPLRTLLATRAWRCEFTAPSMPGSGHVELAQPAPQRYGGNWRAGTGRYGPSAAFPGRLILPAGRALDGVATLHGRSRPIRAPDVRSTVREVLDSGLRWARLPLALQARPDIVTGLGYATCVSASLAIADELHASGHDVRTCRGWLVAPVATGHSWVEMRDTDGLWKVIDPVLVLLRRRLEVVEPAGRRPVPSGVSPGELDLADGLLVNRVLAATLGAREPLAVDGEGAGVEVATAFRKLDSNDAATSASSTVDRQPAN